MSFALECLHLKKSFGDHLAVEQANLSARMGEVIALLGPSGCGKTTTLRLIAGFDAPDEGSILVRGRPVVAAGLFVEPEKRRIGMVFQEYALFPHLDVAGNIGFGLQESGRDRQRHVNEMLTLVGLDGLGHRMPFELSGGQQQRVALARALAPRPDVLLLDEPFSNLDTTLRMQVRAEVRDILRRSSITCVFVTHDQEEALSLADSVAVMIGGRIVQADQPEALYQRPATREVAAFIGEANFIRAEAHGMRALSPLGELKLREPASGAVDVLLRPEEIDLSTDETMTEATVEWREYYGHDQRIGLRVDDGSLLIARAGSQFTGGRGQRVRISITQPVLAFPAPSGESK